MNWVNTIQPWDYTVSNLFNGIPCQVFEGYDIVLDKQGKTTSEFVESKEFQMLEKAGIEVHSGGFS